MKFHKTDIAGAFVIELDRHEDERGFFARSWCAEEFRQQGLSDRLVQCSLSFNRRRGTLRGMHWQAAPHEEAKIVRCIRGAIFDVIHDLRAASPTFGKTVTLELDAYSRAALYIPEGVAHGFQTLEDDTELLYQMSTEFEPSSARTLLWNDPRLQVSWPIPDPILSEKDRGRG